MYFENNKNVFRCEVYELSSDRKDIFPITPSIKYRIYKTGKFEKDELRYSVTCGSQSSGELRLISFQIIGCE